MGIRGHIDCYNKELKEVVDWKTKTLKNLAYFPTKQQIWQVQIYGLLCEENGREVENVTLVAIPRMIVAILENHQQFTSIQARFECLSSVLIVSWINSRRCPA